MKKIASSCLYGDNNAAVWLLFHFDGPSFVEVHPFVAQVTRENDKAMDLLSAVSSWFFQQLVPLASKCPAYGICQANSECAILVGRNPQLFGDS